MFCQVSWVLALDKGSAWVQVARWTAAEAELPFAQPSGGLLLDLNDPGMTFEVVRAADAHKLDPFVLSASAATVLPAAPIKVSGVP